MITILKNRGKKNQSTPRLPAKGAGLSKRYSSICILFFLGIHAVLGQSIDADAAHKQRKISLQWGIHVINKQDQLLSPLIEKDVSFKNMGLSYQHTGEKARNVIQAGFDSYQPSSYKPYTYIDEGRSKDIFLSLSTIVNVRYAHLRRLTNRSLFAGLMLDNQIRAEEQAYGWATTFHYIGAFSLSPVIAYEHHLSEKWQLSLQTWLPLVSWITRSPYALNDDQYMRDNASHNGLKTFFNYVANGKFQSINRFQKINLQSTLTYKLSKRAGWLVSYQIEALRYTQPAHLLSYQHFINTGFQFSF